MTKQQIIETLEQRGYCVLSEYDHGGNFANVYDYRGELVGRCHRGTLDRIKRNNDRLRRWQPYGHGTEYVGDYMCKQYQDYENREHCHRIAEDLDEYAAGHVCRCPECGEIVIIPEDCSLVYRCPECEHIDDVDEFDMLSMWDYFDDCLDIEYRVDRDRDLKSVEVCVACGGPNIYIDTGSHNVELYWWGDRASWPLSSSAEKAVDEWATECWNGGA